MYRFLLTTLASAALLLGTACSSDSSPSSEAASASSAPAHDHSHGAEGHDHAGSHVYQCPMHPEVTGSQPGTCPKCGMKLEHTDNAAGSGRSFDMQLTTTPATLQAGQPVKLSFRPIDKAAPTAPVPLAVVHDKKMHLIIVSRDLREFYHEHPEFGADGTYSVPFTFPSGGDYVLFQDYTPEGDRHQLGRQDVSVAGPPRAAVKYDRDVMSWQGPDGYQAALSFDKPVAAGTPLALRVKLTRSGQPITDLDQYLGALGHMVILSEDTRQYLHVHPADQSDRGPHVGFQTQFEQPGRYRVFLQFQHTGQVRTADFVVNVAPASSAARPGTAQAAYVCPMGCAGSESDRPGKCPTCGMDLEKRA